MPSSYVVGSVVQVSLYEVTGSCPGLALQ
jgi:hypothetical protein